MPTMPAPRLVTRLALTCLLGGILAGCKPTTTPPATQNQASANDPRHPPGTTELAGFLRGSLPAAIVLVELKNDPPVPAPNSPPGGNSWLYNVRLSLAAAEDEFGPPARPDAEAFQTLVDELGGLVAWKEAYAQSPYAGRYPGFDVTPPAPASPQLVAVTRRKGVPAAAIYGQMTVGWQVDHWKYAVTDLDLPQEDRKSLPRSAYHAPILVQGDAATMRYVAAAQATVAAAREKKASIERRYREDLARAAQPGSLYRGQITHGKHAVPAEVRFAAAPPGGDAGLMRFELRLPTTGFTYTGSIKLAQSIPKVSVPAPTRADNPFAQFDSAPPVPKADLILNYEEVNEPKFNRASELANDLRAFLTGGSVPKDVPLTLQDHQLKGRLANLDFEPSFELVAQQTP